MTSTMSEGPLASSPKTIHSDYFFEEDNLNEKPVGGGSSRLAEQLQGSRALDLPESDDNNSAPVYVGPFKLGPVLGRGCTGVVRLATHRNTGFQVAFKIMKKKYLDSKPKLWQKVKREIAILKLIDHPNILKLYDVLETDDRLYLALEHVTGGELFDYIISKGRLDRDLSLRIVAQIVQGLEHCHAHSICHRDLKPENLLLDKNLNIKIADFGMAQLMKRGSLLNTSCGSPHYASPEIINGGAYDGKRTDVWSIGVILFALVTGSLPFDDDHLPVLLNKVAKGQYYTPSFVPEDVADLISRMLTVDPSKRIPMSMIKYHPCYQGTNYFASSTAEFSPATLNRNLTGDIGVVDDKTLADLENLGWGTKEELLKRLKSNDNSGELERVFYRMLMDRKRARLQELARLSPKIRPMSLFNQSIAKTVSPSPSSRTRSLPIGSSPYSQRSRQVRRPPSPLSLSVSPDDFSCVPHRSRSRSRSPSTSRDRSVSPLNMKYKGSQSQASSASDNQAYFTPPLHFQSTSSSRSQASGVMSSADLPSDPTSPLGSPLASPQHRPPALRMANLSLDDPNAASPMDTNLCTPPSEASLSICSDAEMHSSYLLPEAAYSSNSSAPHSPSSNAASPVSKPDGRNFSNAMLSPVRGHSSRVPTRLDMLRNLDNPSAASSSSSHHSPVPSVAAKLMHRPAQRETPARSEREPEVKYVSTPRFHRVRLAPTSEENELSPSSSSSSPKLWWFSNLFSRRPSVSDKPMNATINTNATKSASGGGVYSRKNNAELSNAVNQALASLDVHFQQKGDVWTAEYPSTQPRVPERSHTRRRSSAGLIGMSINASIFSADRKPPVPPADNGASSSTSAADVPASASADSPGGAVKFTIEITQDREDPELKCLHFQHKKGDPVVYQRLQKELQTKLHV